MSVLAGRAGNPPEAKTNYIEPSLTDENRNYAIVSVLAEAAHGRVLTWQDVAHALDALETYDLERESLVAVAAHERLNFYRAVGGTELTLEDFKARCRVALQRGEWI